ncbi:MAG: hypothetical protein ACREJ2_08470 [Planctomycetota bacterium]
MSRGGATALAEASRFFIHTDAVHLALQKIAARLTALHISYVVVGGMALVAHGYDRTTVDVDVLVTAEGSAAAHRQLDGIGYLPPFPGSRQLRDTEHGVRIEFLVTGQFPGDRRPNPVAFPDPLACAEEFDGICYATLECLLEMKLASGMTNPGRLKDRADVQELIRSRDLPAAFADRLNPFVRAKFSELKRGIADDLGSIEAP